MKDESFEVVSGYAVKDRLGRVKVSREARAELVTKFMSCGLTQAEFCRREEINPTTFSGWLEAYRSDRPYTSDTSRSPKGATDTGRTTRSPTATRPAFQELRIESPGVASLGNAAGCTRLTVILPGGVEVRGCDAVTAAELIKALRETR